MARIALFTDPSTQMDTYGDLQFICYRGQKKRRTFDCFFDPKRNTEFHLFYKDRQIGWEYIGEACVVCQTVKRTDDTAPMWQLRINMRPGVNLSENYLRKEQVLDRVGFRSKYKNLSSGIIPLF
jgi:hypothetical protein